MSVETQKVHKLKRTHPRKDSETWSLPKKHRFKDKEKEKFLHFCDIVLEYTKYEPARHDEVRAKNNTSPLDSGGSTAESFTSDSNGSAFAVAANIRHAGMKRSSTDVRSGVSEEDSLDLITCYCMKPFAGRPMIECSDCLTWVHLSCAKIRRNNIPDEFTCQNCKENKLTKRKSDRIRPDRKKTPSPVP